MDDTNDIELSTAERREKAVSDMLKQQKLTREALTLIPREQFSTISDYYGLELDFPKEMRKQEAEDLVWQALIEAKMVKLPENEDEVLLNRELNTTITDTTSNGDTGARPKVPATSNTVFENNISTFVGTNTAFSTSAPLFVTSGMSQSRSGFSPRPPGFSQPVDSNPGMSHSSFSTRPFGFSQPIDRNAGLLGTSTVFTGSAPTFSTAGFSQRFSGPSHWQNFPGYGMSRGDDEKEEAAAGADFVQNPYKDDHSSQMDYMLLNILQNQQRQQEATVRLLQQLGNTLPRNRDDDDLHYLRNVNYLPKFVEGEDVESFLQQFEQACEGVFPEAVWARLLLRQLKGSIRECVQALPDEHRNDFHRVKQAILLKSQKVPESYRRDFRHATKGDLSHTEFVSLLRKRITSWIRSESAENYDDLKELFVKEAFLSKLNPDVREFLVDKRGTLQELALLADKFSCLKGLGKKSSHPSAKNTSTAANTENPKSLEKQKTSSEEVKHSGKAAISFRSACSKCGLRHKSETCPPFTADLDCYNCQSKGHIARVCKEPRKKPPSTAAVVRKTGKVDRPSGNTSGKHAGNRNTSTFAKYCHKGKVKVDGKYTQLVALRDTGAEQTIISRRCLPQNKALPNTMLLRGINGKPFPCPVVKALIKVPALNLRTRWKVAVVDSLAFHGVDMIVGNDIIDSVQPEYPVIGRLSKVDPCNDIEDSDLIFPACVTTRAQANKVDEDRPMLVDGKIEKGIPSKTLEHVSTLNLIKEQQLDPSLRECFNQCTRGDKQIGGQSFHLQNGVLVRKWSPKDRKISDQEAETQIVLPAIFRKKIMTLGHDIPLSGHMGTKASIDRIRRNFFWPNMKRDIVLWVRGCRTCQVSGKPGTSIRKAPLKPLPIVHVPFSRIQIDCVGPLPRTSGGHEYLLTIICLCSRYPEAVPLRSIRSDKIIDELDKFFNHFGWPNEIQSDNGSNFTSNVFQQFCKRNGIKHVTSVPYHPESQGAVERYHQTLKAMLNACALENPKIWHSLVPQLLFCTRTTIHNSLGFTPGELVFGHKMRGPLEVLKNRYLDTEPESSILDQINDMKENHYKLQALAQQHMKVAKAAMKLHYDKGKKERTFEVGDEVLVFLPTENNMFKARFEGPFKITEKLSKLDYRIETPSRRKPSRVVHINQIKEYKRRDGGRSLENDSKNCPLVGSVANEDELVDLSRYKDAEIPSPKMKNSEILNDLDSKLRHVPTDRRNELKTLIQSFEGVFKDTPGRARVAPINIKLKSDASPSYQHPYRYNPEKMEAIEKDTMFLLENDLAAPHVGEWSSPPVVVPKEGGEWRVCQDYRRVNKMIEADALPLPRILDCIDMVGDSNLISKMDLLKGFFQLPLAEEAQNILAFSTPRGLFKYKVLPFGVKIAPTAFQRVMNGVLQGLKGVKCYIDDIVIFSDTWQEHLDSIRQVLQRFKDHNLVVNLDKSDFCQAEITYLGHRVGNGKIKPKEANALAISEMKAPTTVRGVRRLLGAIGFYRRFCPNFSKISHPLTELLKKNRKFVWTSECEDSFQKLKSIIESGPILKAPDFTKPFSLYVDASGTGIGAMLAQANDDDLDMPVAFYSKKLNRHQRNYAPIELECLALVRSLEHFEVYLSSGHPIRIYTDHNPLVFIHRMKNANQKLLRWALYLQKYELDIQHIKGIENVFADMLSRLNESD